MLLTVGYNEVVRESTDGGQNWSTLTTAWAGPNGFSLVGLGFGDGRFMAVGDGGAIGYADATDTSTWTIIYQNDTGPYSNYTLHKPAYGAGVWNIVLRDDATPKIIYSNDGGDTWNNCTIPSNTDLSEVRDIYFDGTTFVAAGRNGVIVYSTDGLTYTEGDYPPSSPGHGYAIVKDEINGLWLLNTSRFFGTHSETKIYSAADPTAASPWTLRKTFTDTAAFPNAHSRGTIAGGTIMGLAQSNQQFSSDGIAWDLLASPPSTTRFTGAAVEGGELFASFLSGAASQTIVAKSSDAENWTTLLQSTGTTDSIYDIASDGGNTLIPIKQRFSNYYIASLVNPITAGDTSITVSVLNGAQVSLDTDEFELLTIDATVNGIGDFEIVKRTTNGTTFTISRDEESSGAKAFPAGTRVHGSPTAQTMQRIIDLANGLIP